MGGAVAQGGSEIGTSREKGARVSASTGRRISLYRDAAKKKGRISPISGVASTQLRTRLDLTPPVLTL